MPGKVGAIAGTPTSTGYTAEHISWRFHHADFGSGGPELTSWRWKCDQVMLLSIKEKDCMMNWRLASGSVDE